MNDNPLPATHSTLIQDQIFGLRDRLTRLTDDIIALEARITAIDADTRHALANHADNLSLDRRQTIRSLHTVEQAVMTLYRQLAPAERAEADIRAAFGLDKAPQG